MVSLRHLAASPLRSLLVLFGIALGVATLIATVAVNRAILASFHQLVERVSGKADRIVTRGEAGVPAELVDELREVEGIAHVAGSLEITTRLAGAGSKTAQPILILGLDFLGDDHFMPMRSSAGTDVLDDPFSLVNDPDAILISRTLSTSTGVTVGGRLDLLTPDGPHAFAVRGILEDEGLAASFGGQIVLMFTEAAQLSFGREGKVDRIDIAFAEGVDSSRVDTRIEAVVGGRGLIEKPEGRTSHLEAITAPIRRALLIAGAIALLVGMFLIYNAVGVAVAQRRREIGVLRALGVTRRRVVMMFAVEAGLLSLIGGGLGIAFGYGLAIVALAQATPTISRFYASIRPPSPEITWDLALLGVTAGVISTLIAALFPAREAARVNPVEALRKSSKRSAAGALPHRTLLLIALGLLVPAAIAAQFATLPTSFAALFLILAAGLCAVPILLIALRKLFLAPVERLFGVPGRLALDNAERSLVRSALTVGALMTSITSSVSVGSWGVSLQHSIWAWLDQSLPADLYVTSGSFIADQHNVAFKPDVMEKLKDVPGVNSVYPVRLTALDVGEKRVQMIALDMVDYFGQIERKKMVGRDPVDGPKVIDTAYLLSKPSVILAENAARKLKKKAGDILTLETAVGTRDFEVYAVVVDYTSDQGTCLIDLKWYRSLWKDELIDTIDIFLEDGASPALVTEELKKRIGGGDTLFVVSAAEVREEIRKVIRQSLAIFDSTDLVALLVALLGVIGTMLAAVLDRIREIGVLRAIGATRSQVVRTIMIESGFLGLAAAIGGVSTGVPMGYVFVKVVGIVGTGWHVDYLFPWEGALRVAVLVILTAAFAGLYPGRKAARMNVPEALAYE